LSDAIALFSTSLEYWQQCSYGATGPRRTFQV
jgi:hypothetical protein